MKLPEWIFNVTGSFLISIGAWPVGLPLFTESYFSALCEC